MNVHHQLSMLGEWCVWTSRRGIMLFVSITGVLLTQVRLRTTTICRPDKLIIYR